VRTIDLLSREPSRLCSSLPYGFYKRTQANLILSCLSTGLSWQLIKALNMDFRRSIAVPDSHRLTASLSVRQQASVVSQREIPSSTGPYASIVALIVVVVLVRSVRQVSFVLPVMSARNV